MPVIADIILPKVRILLTTVVATKNLRRPVVLIDPVSQSLGTVVQERETTSARIKAKRNNPYRWCFCELCGRFTEWETAYEARSVFKRLLNENAKAVSVSEVLRRAAKQEADMLVAKYEEALAGKHGPYEAGWMLFTHCDMQELRGDSSVHAFRDQVERRILLQTWARQGDLLSASRMPNHHIDAPKPSKLYCEAHNPRRSTEARRTYQRDRRFTAEYEELISTLWALHALELPTWDIEAHAEIRKRAYDILQSLKSSRTQIQNLLATERLNQSEIATRLGISRQAVSISIKRTHKKETFL